MASETELPEISSLFERLLRNRDLSLFLPFMLGFTRETEDRGASERESSPGERIILINPFTQGMVVIEGASGLDSLLRGVAGKDGQPPASEASIEAMPVVEVGDGQDGECVICLENWVCGDLVKEMPCKHKFHGGCIEKWLGIHGSCPVCRFEMPAEEEEVGKKREEERRRVGSDVWVSFSFNGYGRSRDSDSGSDQNSSSADAGDHHEMEQILTVIDIIKSKWPSLQDFGFSVVGTSQVPSIKQGAIGFLAGE